MGALAHLRGTRATCSPLVTCLQRVRHQASQDDRLQRYGWVRHDGRTWGQQVLVDGTYNLTLTMVRSLRWRLRRGTPHQRATQTLHTSCASLEDGCVATRVGVGPSPAGQAPGA